jgi:hypothetical protein
MSRSQPMPMSLAKRGWVCMDLDLDRRWVERKGQQAKCLRIVGSARHTFEKDDRKVRIPHDIRCHGKVPEPNGDLPLDACLGEPLLDHLMAGRPAPTSISRCCLIWSGNIRGKPSRSTRLPAWRAARSGLARWLGSHSHALPYGFAYQDQSTPQSVPAGCGCAASRPDRRRYRLHAAHCDGVPSGRCGGTSPCTIAPGRTTRPRS